MAPEPTLDPRLNYITQNVPPGALLNLRNEFAVHSAYIRGSPQVVLHNAANLKKAQRQIVRTRLGTEIAWGEEDDYREDHHRVWPRNWEPRTERRPRPPEIKNFAPGEWDGFKLEWVDKIGQGGLGYATLWRAIFEDGDTKLVVIKIDMKGNMKSAKDELKWHRKYLHASHTVQPVDLNEIVAQKRQQNPALANTIRGIPFNATSHCAFVLEYAEGGSLENLIYKIAVTKDAFPKRVLWEMWDCLVMGVASVKYQPALAESFDLWVERAINGSPDDVEDFFTRLGKLPAAHHVHFDLEDSNILLGRSADHTNGPALKLHDFGFWSVDMEKAWEKWPEGTYWSRRRAPKDTCITPEQITEDWDKIEYSMRTSKGHFTSDDLSKGHKIAGRYGNWTNVFLIAKLMERIISGIDLATPFTNKPFRSRDGTTEGNTYGWRVKPPRSKKADPLRNRAADLGLLDEIMACQIDLPSQRLTIEDLLRSLIDRKRRGYKESDDSVRAYWLRVLQDVIDTDKLHMQGEVPRAPEQSHEGLAGPAPKSTPDAEDEMPHDVQEQPPAAAQLAQEGLGRRGAFLKAVDQMGASKKRRRSTAESEHDGPPLKQTRILVLRNRRK